MMLNKLFFRYTLLPLANKNKILSSSPSVRIYWIVILFMVILSVYFITNAYLATLKAKQTDTLDKLKCIATTLSLTMDGNHLEEILTAYPNIDGIQSSEDDSLYYAFHRLLKSTYEANDLNSDIYTLSYDSASSSFYFGITSGVTPYFRHKYNSHPEHFVNGYSEGGLVEPYKDDHGTWLSAFAPIKNDNGETVAVIVADKKFADFTEEARMILFRDIAITLFVLVVLSLLVRRIIKRILLQEERSKAMIERSSQLLQEKNKKITDSIHYAKRIQDALMQDNHQQINGKLGGYFDIFLPRDIVSGDFLWHFYDQDTKQLLIVNGDCTGHGVPGALMSIIGMTALNELVAEKRILRPNHILRLLDHKISHLLHQHDEGNNVHDGMDVGICLIDFKNMELHFAGAHHPLLLYTDNKLQKLKSDRLSIGGHQMRKAKAFDVKKIPIHKGDRLYLYSDGIIDQFGSPPNSDQVEKFKTRRFKKLLEDIQGFGLEEQKSQIIQVLNDWKKDERQLDDISVVGLEI